jgi:hypothetical protein
MPEERVMSSDPAAARDASEAHGGIARGSDRLNIGSARRRRVGIDIAPDERTKAAGEPCGTAC